MSDKRCTKCGTLKSISEYYQRKTGSRSGNFYEICKDCFKNRGRQYYHKTRTHQLELVKKRVHKYREARRLILVKLKNQPCADCGKSYPPWAMDFDHKSDFLKAGYIGHMYIRGMWKVEKLLDEIDKCDLVCFNCHRQRTYQKGNRNYGRVLEKLRLEGYKFLWENSSQAAVAKVVTAPV